MINVNILKKKRLFLLKLLEQGRPHLAVPQLVTSRVWFAPMANIVNISISLHFEHTIDILTQK